MFTLDVSVSLLYTLHADGFEQGFFFDRYQDILLCGCHASVLCAVVSSAAVNAVYCTVVGRGGGEKYKEYSSHSCTAIQLPVLLLYGRHSASSCVLFPLVSLAMASKILKPYLRKFVLQTHPDFFHHDKLRKTTNAASLQSLYDVLQPSTTTSRQPASTVKLEFFVKGQKKKDKNTVSSVFCSRDSDWDKADSFLKLCQQANIAVLPTDLEMVQDMVKKQSAQHAPAPKYKSLTKEFAEKLHKEQTSTPVKQDWTEGDIANQSLIMFDPSVNKKLTASKLSQWLPQLQPQLWWGKIPLLILASTSEQPPKELTRGMLVIRSDMELQGRHTWSIGEWMCLLTHFLDIQRYLDDNLSEIIKESALKH